MRTKMKMKIEIEMEIAAAPEVPYIGRQDLHSGRGRSWGWGTR